MLDALNQIDVTLFYFINVTLQNPFSDWFMPFITDKYNWFPVWAVIIVLLIWKGGRQGRIMVLLIIPVIFLSDQIASHIMKPFFERARPCTALSDVHLLVNAKSSYSMPSAHAANYFALAFFFSYYFRKYAIVFYLTAFTVGLSRIFVGVHYPFDVLIGGLVGIFCAGGVIGIWNYISRRWFPDLGDKNSPREKS